MMGMMPGGNGIPHSHPSGHLSHSPFLKGTVTGYRLQPLPIQGHLDLPEGDLIVRTWSMKPSGWRLTS